MGKEARPTGFRTCFNLSVDGFGKVDRIINRKLLSREIPNMCFMTVLIVTYFG